MKMKKLSANEIGMIVIIVLLLVGVASRWKFIKKEGGEAIEYRLNRGEPTP